MNFQNVYPPCTNMKAPSGRLSGDGSSQGRRHGGAFGSSYPQTFFVPPKILFSSKKYVQPFGSRVYPLFCRTLQSYNSPGDWARELSKPSTDSASLVVKIEKKKRFSISVGGFLEVTSQRRDVLEILATFGRPWAPTHWPILLAQSFVEN